MELIGLFGLDEAAFRQRFRHTPLWRPRRRGLLRNAAIVLGNRPTREALPALVKGLNDHEPLVRSACAWAIAQYQEPSGEEALRQRRCVEADAVVLQEIDDALGGVSTANIKFSLAAARLNPGRADGYTKSTG
jgi:epoxyqueuosine reductase